MSQQYWNSTILIHLYSLQHWFINTDCSEYDYNFDIKHISFDIYVWFILLLIQIQNFRKILIILINDLNDSNSSKFTVLVVVAVTKTKKRKKKTKPASKANIEENNLLLNTTIVVFVYELYLFCDSCKSRFIESRNQQHHTYC